MAEGGEQVEGVRGSGSGTPNSNTKEAVKSLTAQMKDMALKFCGANKQCKPCTGSSSSYKKGHRAYYPDFDAASEGVPLPYPYMGGSCSSTPAWNFTSASASASHHPGYPYMGGSCSSTPAWNFTSACASASHHPGRSDSRFTPAAGNGMESFISAQDLVLEEDDEPKEWTAQVEPGVHITFVSLPNGGNHLKRIRFSREMFNKWQAQRWWGENYDRIMELYNVQRFNRQALHTPTRCEDEMQRDSWYSRMGSGSGSGSGSGRESPMADHWTPRNNYKPYGGGYYPPSEDHMDEGGAGGGLGPRGEASFDASRTTTSSSDVPSVSVSNGSEMEAAEWVEQDEPGVYITIRQLAQGTRELRRVRFSRERFGEVNAKQWWEENRERIQTQYLLTFKL